MSGQKQHSQNIENKDRRIISIRYYQHNQQQKNVEYPYSSDRLLSYLHEMEASSGAEC